MSQYIAPPSSASVETLIREVHQQQWLMSERLFGNGQPGEIDELHKRITSIQDDAEESKRETRDAITEIQLWQAGQGGASAVLQKWLMPILGLIISACALFVAFHK